MNVTHAQLPRYNIGVHFLTAKTFRNTPYFRDPTCARIFCEELESARQCYKFHVLAFVVMPDHIHLLLWWDTEILPELTISRIAWATKGKSARRIVGYLKRVAEGNAFRHPPHPELRPVRRPTDRPHHRNWRYKIWQKGTGYDFNIYTERKLLEKVAHIHANPIRAGLAPAAEAYPWSSAGTCAGQPALNTVTITPISEVLS